MTDLKSFAETEIRKLTESHAMLTQRAEQCAGAIAAYRQMLEQIVKQAADDDAKRPGKKAKRDGGMATPPEATA